MFQTVEQAADHITDILMEKSADGFMDTAKNLGTKALGGLRTAGRYMTERASDAQGGMKNTFHSALGGNDATHWGALGAIGLGGLGAVKGLIAPDEGKGRVRSMISNAALGALMGGAGGGAAGMLGKNPTLGGSLFKGNREKVNELEGDVNKSRADLNLNTARAALGPVGAVASAIGGAPNTGWGNAALTAGNEALKPLQETVNNLGQTTGASLGAHNARRAWQLGNLNKNLTTGDVKISPLKGMFDPYGHLSGTTMAETTINSGTLGYAANRALAKAPAAPAAPAPIPALSLPKGVNTVNTANMPNIPPGAASAASGGHDIQEVIKELKDVITGGAPPKGGGGAVAPPAGKLPPGFGDAQYLELAKSHGNTTPGRAALQSAIDSGSDYKFKTRVPLGGTWKGMAGSQVAGQLIASQLRNLPQSLKRIQEIDGSPQSHPDKAFMARPIPPGELQIAEKALSDFQNRKR